ncbi:SDR family NAD(P)-dependent oxidoreductase [Devosia sp. CAU 1758]
MSPRDLAGRRALVTGGSSGIGRAIALGLAGRGAEVIIHHHDQAEVAAATAGLIVEQGGVARVVSADFIQPDAAGKLVEGLLVEHGAIDILIANAAIERRGPWLEIDAAMVGDHVQANFIATLNMMQACMPPMLEREWGRIVCIGSIMADRPRSETLTYASLKSAQLTAVRSIARDVAAGGVTINVVSPGAIVTERTVHRYADPAFAAAVCAKIPAGRPGTPEDIVAPVLLLCSQEASYITGTNIMVDGGWSIGDAPA